MSPQLTMLHIEDDVLQRADMQSYLDTVEDIALVGATGSATEGIKLLVQHKPDVVILDLELSDGNGITFLEDMQLARMDINPFVFVTTRTRASVVRDAVEALGAQYFYSKNNPAYSAKAVISILRSLFKFSENRASEYQYITNAPAKQLTQDKERDMRRALSLSLAHLSIPAGKDANAYLVDSILFVVSRMESGLNSPDLKNDIFPIIAEKYKVKNNSIDRSLRYALESAWTRTDQAILDKFYPFPMSSDRDCPSPKEFIFNMATTLY